MSNRSEEDWVKFGEANPFFGVLSNAKFLAANLSEQSLEEFYHSGEQHVEHVYSSIEARVRSGFRADRVLDFGCGVGRLLIPFARRARAVVGIDVSPGMLAQAEKNSRKEGLENVRLLRSEQLDTLEKNGFELVHSYIVFQHIPPAHGEQLFQKLVGLIATGGMGVIHLTYFDERPGLRRAVSAIRAKSGLLHRCLNVVQGRAFASPLMQMNCYSMNRLFNILFDSHCSIRYVEFTDHGGFRGATLYFEKG